MKQRRKTFRRGRTRPERAALLDALLGGAIPLPESDPFVFVDVGYGDAPDTTERTHEELLKRFTKVETTGVEAEESRVARALVQRRTDCHFRFGGFELPALGIEDASLIRCFNVLRGYGLWDVKTALLQMARGLRPGGVLIEGTSDVLGALSAVHIWRRGEAVRLNYHGLLCVTDFSRGFSPLMFRDVLPRDLRRHAKPGEPVFEWLNAWNDVAIDTRRRHPSKDVADQSQLNAGVFIESAARLKKSRPDTDDRFAALGALLWTPERPSTRPEVLSPDDPLE